LFFAVKRDKVNFITINKCKNNNKCKYNYNKNNNKCKCKYNKNNYNNYK